jgi:deazaflavin-dependent oxidoreductase (nitroreductase family)
MATKTGPTRITINPVQKFFNKLVLSLLATPGVSKGIGARLLTVYAVGRKTGRAYTVPVAYTTFEDALVIGTPFGWAKNLRTGEPVWIRLKGKKIQADVEAFTDEENVTRLFAALCTNGGAFASFNKIRMSGGVPNPSDLHDAWADGSRAFRLTPR